jgi:hypothetical protein
MKGRNRFFGYTLFAVTCLFPIPALASSDVGLRVIDESAIAYMEFLSKDSPDKSNGGCRTWKVAGT